MTIYSILRKKKCPPARTLATCCKNILERRLLKVQSFKLSTSARIYFSTIFCLRNYNSHRASQYKNSQENCKRHSLSDYFYKQYPTRCVELSLINYSRGEESTIEKYLHAANFYGSSRRTIPFRMNCSKT